MQLFADIIALINEILYKDMARALLAILAYSIATTVARDHDYSGPPIPHYHFEPERRDAMQLDYELYDKGGDPAFFDNDVEKPRYDKNRASLAENTRVQQSRQLPHKYLKEDDRMEDDFEHEDISPDMKPTLPRKKNNYYHNANREVKYNHFRDEDINSLERRHSVRQNVRDENEQDYDREVENFYLRKNARKKARRKPRDRAINRDILHERTRGRQIDIDRIDKRSREDDLEEEYPNEIKKTTEEVEPPPKLVDLAKIEKKGYKDDEEYFDMKRISGIKHKLPTLLGRTKVSNMETPSEQQRLEEYRRRANNQDITTFPAKQLNTTLTSTSIITRKEEIITTTESSDDETETVVSKTTELSLAEKSRLSILRKAIKKESLKNSTWTTKPPVLMQVTQRMETVIVVERLNDKDTRSELKEISNESPARIQKAKKLMRHKLVAGARSIQDLTDNWDEMVCDYIDVSLLENKGIVNRYHFKCIHLLILQIVCLSF